MDPTNLKELRRVKGLLQREVADKSDISIPFYSLIENGLRMPSLKCSKKICQVLGISLDEFFILVKENKNKL